MRLFLLLWVFLSTQSFCDNQVKVLKVYTYDSWTGKGSLGEWVEKEFLKKTGHALKLVSFGSANEALNQIQLEKANPMADVLVGVDSSMLVRAKATLLFERLEETLFRDIKPELKFYIDRSFVPFDHGFLSFVYDETRLGGLEKKIGGLSLKQFSELPELKSRVIIQDPRTSSIGFSFLLWSRKTFPSEAGWNGFWTQLNHQLLTISPGWSAAYGLFLKKEADFVLSYTTSPAYHIEKEKSHHIKALIFSEGHYPQIEGMGVLKSSKNKALALEFLKLVLSPETQSKVPLTQWMYPVLRGIALPKSFESLKVPVSLPILSDFTERERKNWLQDWTKLLSKPK